MSETGEADAAAAAGSARYCGYSQCEKILPSQTRPGRKSEYCEDRRWQPGNKTCKQMAQAERAAVKAAGLDVPLAAYRDATEKFLPQLEAFLEQLGGPLTELVDTVRAVENGALARIAEEEQVALSAVNRAEQMITERDQAARESRVALAEAKQAKEEKIVAQRLQRDAEKKRDDQRDADWNKVADHRSKQAAAEAKAAEVSANLTAQVDRYKKLAEQTDTLRESNKTLTKANTALETSLKTAQEERSTATTLAEKRAKEARDAGEAKAAAEAALETLRTELERTRNELAAEKKSSDGLQTELTAQKGRADELATELNAANTTIAQLRTDLVSATSDVEQARADLAAERTAITSVRADLDQTKAELTKAEARAATVEELRALIAQGATKSS